MVAIPRLSWNHSIFLIAAVRVNRRAKLQTSITQSHDPWYIVGRLLTFTAQVEDGTGLYYYNSRYYDPQLGQFLSPDTIVPEPTNLLSYNRYLYGFGNPVKFSDPSGHYSVEELQKHFGVNSFEELTALFGEGGQYEGNSGWYDILRAAQDGDQITAYLPNPTISVSGSFMRNDEGRIQIDMGGVILFPKRNLPKSAVTEQA